MKKTKKALASLAIMGMIATMVPINAFADTTVDRYAGVNRYETAAKIAAKVGSPNKVAILTAGMDANLVDALAAAPFAAAQKAPILLTGGTELDSYTAAQLTTLGVTKVYITTGATVITKAVTDKLTTMGITFEFVGGANRYETALNLAKKLSAPTGVIVASANDASMVDSLAVASIAAANNMAIVLTDKGMMAAGDLAYVKGLNVPTYVIGSDAVVSDAVCTALSATRVGGANRYATNVAVMNQFKSKVNFDTVYAASGSDAHLVDALAGAPLAAQSKSAIVLADMTVSSEVTAFAGTVPINNVIALGSTGVVPASVVAGIKSPVGAELKVVSVTAINAKQLVVVFNQQVDEDSAEDYSNYTVKDDGDEIAVLHDITSTTMGDDRDPVQDVLNGPLLQADGKTVVITTSGFDNPTTASITIDGVEDLKGVALAETTIKDIAVSDTTLPTVKKVEVLGPDRIKVSFSEPVSFKQDLSNYTIDDGDYVVSDFDWVENQSAVELILGTDLSEGAHEIVVNDGDFDVDAIVDAAGYNLLKTTIKFSVIPDTTPIIASIKSATQTEVVVKFNKAVKVDDEDSLLVYQNSTRYEGTIEEDATDFEDEWTLDFSANPLPGGTVTIYIDQDEEDDAITDAWGNEVTVDKIKLNVNVVDDVTAPTLTSVKVSDEDSYHEFTIAYSEDVDTILSNYTLENADGDEMALSDFAYDSDENEVTFFAKEGGGLLSGGKYTLIVEDVTDTSPAENEMAKYTKVLNIEDVINPEVDSVVYSKADDKVMVQFSEAMTSSGSASIADMDNYMVSFDNGGSFADLDSDDSVTVSSDKTYAILDLSDGTKPTNTNWDNFQIRVVGVKDAVGNLLEGRVATFTDPTEDSAPGIQLVEAITDNKILVTFDTLLDKVNALGIELVYADGTPSGVGVSTVSRAVNDEDYDFDVTEVTYKLGKDLNTDGTYGVDHKVLYVTIDGSLTGITSVLGTKSDVVKSAATTVTDKTAPELNDAVVDEDGNIILTFTEKIYAFAPGGKNGLSVTGDGIYKKSTQDIDGDGTVQEAELDKIKLIADVDDVFSKDTEVNYSASSAGLEDNKGNDLASFSNEEVDEL